MSDTLLLRSSLRLPVGFTGELPEYSHEAARQIGALLPHLTARHNGSPIGERALRFMIQSPDHAQLVAIRSGIETDNDPTIVGAASMSTVCEAFLGRVAWLGSFVVHPEYRGSQAGEPSVAQSLWGAMHHWCKSRNLETMAFNTSPERSAAVAFYQRNGTVFRPEQLVGHVDWADSSRAA